MSHDGRELARALTGDHGRFVFHVSPGRYRIRSERIGYRVWESTEIDVESDVDVEMRLKVTAIPSRLADIEVREESECRPVWDDIDTGTLWEEARKALAAASWTQNQRLYDYRIHNFTVIDRQRQRPEVDVSTTDATSTLPFSAIDFEQLIEDGYVENIAGVWHYYGPDADVLLDTRFLETHCFGTQRGKGELTGMLGLTFRPVSTRRVPEIEGVLWIDAKTSELKQIEYEYTRLPFSARSRDAGGSIGFEVMGVGAWIIHDWVINMPLFERSLTMSGVGARSMRTAPWGQGREGARVIEAFDLSGERVYVHPDVVHVKGTVFDSILGGPAHGQPVYIPDTGYTTVTDSGGAYVINTLLEGQYELTSGRIDSLGIAPTVVRFIPADTIMIDLVVPSLSAIHYAVPERIWRVDLWLGNV